MAREYVALAFLEEVRDTVIELMKEKRGCINLQRLEQLLTEHYHYPFKGTILTESEVDANPQLSATREKLLLYKDGFVYLNGKR